MSSALALLSVLSNGTYIEAYQSGFCKLRQRPKRCTVRSCTLSISTTAGKVHSAFEGHGPKGARLICTL